MTDVHYKQEMETLFVSPAEEKIALEVFAMYLYNDEWFFFFPGVISHLGCSYHLSNLEHSEHSEQRKHIAATITKYIGQNISGCKVLIQRAARERQ